MNNSQELEKLNKTLLNHIQSKHFPGELALRRMGILLDRLGNPQLDYQVIHVAGTSGKGSTVLKISFGLQKIGYKVGSTVSPHIVDVRERFQVNQDLISPAYGLQLISEIHEHTKDFDQLGLGQLSFFEMNLVIAFLLWSRENVDFAVVETGLGGKLDPTNVLSMKSKVAVITHIDYDHQNILGNTLTEIASQKAGIIWPGNKVIVAPQSEEALKVLSNKLDQSDIDDKFILDWIDRRYGDTSNDFDRLNTIVALESIKKIPGLKTDIDWKKLESEINNHQIPGRFHKVNDKLIIDGAHNPDKMSNLIAKLEKEYPLKKFSFILGIKDGKDSRKMLELIIPIASKIYLTGFEIHADMVQKGQDTASLESQIREITGAKNVDITQIDLSENTVTQLDNIVSSSENIVVVTGSTYLSGQILTKITEREKNGR